MAKPDGKLMSLEDAKNNINTFIFETYKKNKIPTDKRGNFFITGKGGGCFIEDVVSPSFTEMDLITALLLDMNKKNSKT